MTRIFASTTLLALLSIACGGDAAPAAAPAPVVDAAPLTAVIEPYITIQETLAADSVDALPQLAAKVITGSEAIQSAPGVDALIAGAGRLPSADIETARVAFEKMSMGLIRYLKANPSQQAGLEVIHCTMAFNNKGAYWVQRKGEISNPYHGKMMLRCGDALGWETAPG